MASTCGAVSSLSISGVTGAVDSIHCCADEVVPPPPPVGGTVFIRSYIDDGMTDVAWPWEAPDGRGFDSFVVPGITPDRGGGFTKPSQEYTRSDRPIGPSIE